MNVAVHVSPEVAAAWPAYEAAVVIAEDVTNGPSDEASERLLASAERAARESGLERAADDPRIAAWRAVFSEFGSKPSRYPSSAESLLARVLKGGELPRINALVDTYNAVSVRHVIPVGGEDLDGSKAICAWCAPRTARSSGATTKASPAGAGTGVRSRARSSRTGRRGRSSCSTAYRPTRPWMLLFRS